jgi:hypothetical protein
MKASAYILVSILAFTGFLIVFAPVSPIWSLVKEDATNVMPALTVLSAGGSIWNGKSQIQLHQFPPSRLTWEISPFELLKGKVATTARAVGDGHFMDLEAELNSAEAKLKAIDGQFNSDFINSVSQHYGMTFSGLLSVDETFISTDKNRITDAGGSFHWSGGLVTVANPSRTLELPPLDGELHLEDQLLVLDITHQLSSALKVTLNKEGWATIAIKGTFFDIANLARPEGTSPGETILLLEEKLL